MKHLPVLPLVAFLLACGGSEPAPGAVGGSAPNGAAAGDTVSSDTSTSGSTQPGPSDLGTDTDQGDQGEWGTDARSGSGAASQAVLDGVRVAAHREGGYDRFVLEFSDDLPDWTVQYPTDPLHQCGSGHPIELEAPTPLQITLRSAAAHDQEGNATVEERTLEPGLQMLRSARLTCDFEGEVEWVLGLAGRAPFRVMALSGPSRLVVDVRR